MTSKTINNITATPSESQPVGQSIMLSANTDRDEDTVINWSSSDTSIAVVEAPTSPVDSNGKAMMSVALTAAGNATITATEADTPANTNSIDLTATPVQQELDLEVNSYPIWCANWDGIPKTFTVTVKGNDGKPVPGVPVVIAVADDDNSGITLVQHLNPQAVTNSFGSVEVLAKFSDMTAGSTATITVTAGEPAVSKNWSFVISESQLNSTPSYNSIIDDGYIDDTEAAGGIYAGIFAAGLARGDIITLYFGNYSTTLAIDDPNDGQQAILVPSVFLINGHSLSSFQVTDVAGNSTFSRTIDVEVRLEDGSGGGGIVDLAPLSVPEGEDGVINQTDSDLGVNIVIEENKLREATNGILYAQMLHDGEHIGPWINCPLSVPPADGGNRIELSDKTDAVGLANLFNSVGEGDIELYYELQLSDGLHSSKKIQYVVDVIAP
ncbi:hypothetical protein [Vibrio aestuarianus]|uniref:hypothetical protein n=1 Tax=Vibrio aestuarianus TaxID=28171 RepID=UPI00237D2F94|nr:hypothetical protein [Vibrio aestuarianus]MDE1232527.1 hypothetical protein [Vibrio aestuarianus]